MTDFDMTLLLKEREILRDQVTQLKAQHLGALQMMAGLVVSLGGEVKIPDWTLLGKYEMETMRDPGSFDTVLMVREVQ